MVETGQASSGKSKGMGKGVGKLKKDIRNIKRLLSKVESLPPTVRQENERKLEVLINKLEETKLDNVTKKYKMVRFFEKRKLFRKLKTALSTHGDDSDEVKGIRDQINYIVYYPLGEKYVSILPKESYKDQAVIDKQRALVDSISAKVASGELADASQGDWSRDRPVPAARLKALQADGLSLAERKVHSKPIPEPAEQDDFFVIDRGTS